MKKERNHFTPRRARTNNPKFDSSFVAHREHKESPRQPSANAEQRVEMESAREESALLYGVAPVAEALRAGSRGIERILIVENAHEHRLRELLALARERNVPVRRATRAELDRLTVSNNHSSVNHQGVVAVIAAARYLNARELLDKLAERTGANDPPLAVVLDGVEDPRNLGAILRTAECAGAHGVFLPERRAVGLTETVAKTAAGALEYVPVARAGNIVRLIEDLKNRNIWTIGTAADAEIHYTDWNFNVPCALVFGGEGAGLRRLVAERCDALVRIPLRGRIESLNVSVAAGVLLYEVLRQRTLASRATYKEIRARNEKV